MRVLRIAGVVLNLVAGAVLTPAAVGADVPVDLELVLAVDVSGSMDIEELRVQRAGYIAALTHASVLRAIRGGYHRRIAVAYVEWGGPAWQMVIVPWRVVEDEATAQSFVARLSAAPVFTVRGTSLSGILGFAPTLFDDNGFEGVRRVIDVSGDGPNNMGAPVEPARDAALARGIVINGLPIMIRPSLQRSLQGMGLDQYYEECVTGGPGSFVLPVTDLAQFAEAIRQKLVLEIAGRFGGYYPAQTRARGMNCFIGELQRFRP